MTGRLRLNVQVLDGYRQLNDWTWEQFAERLHMSSAYLSNLKSRKRLPSWETIEAIIEETGIDVARLLEFERDATDGESKP